MCLLAPSLDLVPSFLGIFYACSCMVLTTYLQWSFQLQQDGLTQEDFSRLEA